MLTISELADIRADYVATFLTDTATILTKTTVSGPNGAVPSFVSSGSVPCRYEALGSSGEGQAADSVLAQSGYAVYLPFGTVFAPKDRLQIGATVLEIIGLNSTETESVCACATCMVTQ